ncbi:hypothetical protein GCM10009096_27240 [Parasphingorhabdus litoris]|uniref:CPBP family intramembrane metalloprotease n=1 Tax=Parasphingorhabdus litoris TaxID=394733 RepID=A0ABN1ATC2_9SPHN
MFGFATAFWIGIGLATLYIWSARTSALVEKLLGAGLLMSIGLWYLGFGIFEGATLTALVPQILGGLFFAALGYLGFTRSLFFPGIGWMIHATWDFASPHFSDVSYMPEWAAPMCLGFDILVGIYLLARSQELLHATHQGNVGSL